MADAERGDLRRFSTVVLHAGEHTPSAVQPLTDPIAVSTAFAFGDPAIADARRAADPPEPNYSRDGLANVRAFEATAARLEGAEDAYATASGMAAISLVLLSQLGVGDRIVVSSNCYCDTWALLSDELSRFGIEAVAVDDSDPGAVAAALARPTALIFVETISNPGIKLADLPGLAESAKQAGAVLCVDNTFATPALCRPIEHGADLVVHSATKFLGGHHDATAGVIAGRRDLIGQVRRRGELFGSTLGAMDVWLVVRGMKTLAPRLAWMSESAAAIARFLTTEPAVTNVCYPGLPNDRRRDLVRRLLPNGCGAMLAFDLLGGPMAAEQFIRRLRLIAYALSLGGTTTTVCYPPRTATTPEHSDRCEAFAPNATIRMSVGLEAAEDLIADLAQALTDLPNGRPS